MTSRAEVRQNNSLPFVALMTANGISMTGNMLAFVAIPWFVLQTTGSAALTGVTGFIIALASVVAAFFGGAVVDRLGFKRSSIIADVTSGVAIGLLPLLYATVGLQFWELLAIVFIGNLMDAPGTTAREALIPELAEKAGVGLERASSTLQAVERGSRLIGAPLAGILIAVIGTNNVLWLDLVSFAVSALLVALCVPALHPTSQTSAKGHFLAELKEGIGYLARDPLILAIVVLVMITNFLDGPLGGVILPVYTNKFLGSAVGLGLIIGVSGGGALLGAIIFGAIGHRLPRRAVFFGGFLIVAVHFWVFVLIPPLWVILVAQLIGGIASGPLNPIISTIQYERIPAEVRGRVFGAVTAGAYIAIPISLLLAGYALELFDIRLIIAFIGACYVITITSALFIPAMREMNSPMPVSFPGPVRGHEEKESG